MATPACPGRPKQLEFGNTSCIPEDNKSFCLLEKTNGGSRVGMDACTVKGKFRFLHVTDSLITSSLDYRNFVQAQLWGWDSLSYF